MLHTRPRYTGAVSEPEDYWPGKVFGLPESGPRSVPSIFRRILALALDWAIAVGVSLAFFNYAALAIVAAFTVMHMIFGVVLGGSPGHLVTKMRIVPVKGGALGIVAPIVRPLLLILVIPALIMDRDQRGVHERIVGTILVSR
jgi:hypothetical protein